MKVKTVKLSTLKKGDIFWFQHRGWQVIEEGDDKDPRVTVWHVDDENEEENHVKANPDLVVEKL